MTITLTDLLYLSDHITCGSLLARKHSKMLLLILKLCKFDLHCAGILKMNFPLGIVGKEVDCSS